jgi:hypothetical protein
MILLPNANALTAAGLADFAACELHLAGLRQSGAELRLTAAECVAPLLQAAAVAIELSGATREEDAAAVRDIILDYIRAPLAPADPARAAAE